MQIDAEFMTLYLVPDYTVQGEGAVPDYTGEGLFLIMQ